MWLDYIKENRGDDVHTVVIGNKIDDTQERTVSSEQAAQKFGNIGVSLFEVSAKTGQNLQRMFTETCLHLVKGNQFETSVAHIEKEKPPKKEPQKITGEKERPIVKTDKASTKPVVANEGEMRGSKLIKKQGNNGNFVK